MKKNILHPQKTALIVFAKRPELGQGKQRLAAETGNKIAFAAAELLLKKTIEVLEEWEASLIISASSQKDSEWACNLTEKPVISIPQRSGSLGERLEQIDQEARMLGFSHLIFIGTDAPLLDVEDLNKIMKDLEYYDQVFMPASDGGVIVMASRVPWTKLQHVNWSTEKVFTQLKSLAVQQGRSLKILKKKTDLDDIASFKRLKPQLVQACQRKKNQTIEKLIALLDTNE